MSFSDLTKIVNNAAQALHNSEKLPLPILAVQAEKAKDIYPNDITIATASNVLNKMASSGKIFITRGEFTKIYNDLYTSNTKFAEVFADEIISNDLATPTYSNRTINDGEQLDYSTSSDPVLANALNEIFEADGTLKLYSDDLAKKAEKSCLAELISLEMKPKTISIFTGRNDIFICKAEYETPKGVSSVLIPVEISDNKALFPNMFLAQEGMVDLTAEDLQSHIMRTAGKSFKIGGEQLLTALATAKYGPEKPLNDVERAIMKSAMASETNSDYTSDGILYQQMESPIEDVKLEQAEEFDSFAEKLSSAKGIAATIFGDKVVASGRDLIVRELNKLGFKNNQVKVADNNETTIFYAVSLGTAGFNVPVAVKEGKVNYPSIVLASGKIFEFSKGGIGEIVNSKEKDVRNMAIASKMSELAPSDLVNRIKIAMTDEDFERAEDALNCLANTDDSVSYHAGLAAYMNGLGMKNKLAESAKKLEEIIETPVLIDYKIFQ